MEEGEVLEAIEFSLRFRFFENALLLCQEFFPQFPSSNFLFLYAKTYIDSGSPSQAVLLISRYHQYLKDSPDLYLIYSQSYFESGNYSGAESVLKQLDTTTIVDEQKRKDFTIAKTYLLGLIKIRTHRQSQAETDFIQTLEIQPLMLSSTSHISHQRNSPTPVSLTETLYTNSLNLPDDIKNLPPPQNSLIVTQKSLAIHYFKRSKYTEAANVFKNLYAAHPYCVDGIDIYSTTLWQLKDESTLSELVQRTISLAPNRPEAWIATGNLLSLRKNSEEAINMFNRAASLDRSCSYALTLSGHESLMIDMLKEASILFRQAIDRNQYEWSAWYGLGNVYFKQDDFCSAEYYTRKAIDINPESSVLYFVYATILNKCNRKNKALEALDKALSLDENNLVAIYLKSEILNECGKNLEALQCIDKVSYAVRNEPDFALLRGKIAQQLGDMRQSLYWFVEAIICGYPNYQEVSESVDEMIDNLVNSILEQKSENS
ncbi:TPR Domain containing protein [Histomonas meleagridis]|uniref:TPR Domain containing protein n=1 Tax=Histomonas meleagridis TaxID=135588 RepID=UPI00355A4277|nr:TPR Domain containing protein [Histomonas meleagridis]KAH0796271.1 TPR Domain containing protein [Histomonas meleagridis]